MKVSKVCSLLAFVFVVSLSGCGDDKAGPAKIPTDLNKELPKVAGTAGGAGPAKKAANPGAKAD
jgi:uncharacterized lipoprotein YehR (DUF1307 family)